MKLNKVWTVKADKEDNIEEDDEKDEDFKNIKSVVIDEIKSKNSNKDESIKIMIENEEEEI